MTMGSGTLLTKPTEGKALDHFSQLSVGWSQETSRWEKLYDSSRWSRTGYRNKM